MKLLKPKWVNHSGKPIFTVDIHPDGTRFATGGQADDTGRISIWNIAPVADAKDEANESIPKMLCLLDNHSGCVNCVRWSNNGKFLASGADDKFIMIWQIGRGYGSSTVFGSSGTVVNIEQWRCVHILRGHAGDILDLSWSPDDRFLASGSVDNTVHIWNAEKFPDLVIVLRGHQGLVKGVTWDPVGKYFASQSDDKTLKIWRVADWKLDATVTEPFDECGGTTHVLRLNWSPDGQYVVSAHAMNNGGPVAKIVERDGWKARMDFVGHRKAITCVRFNSRLFTKPSPTDPSKFKQYACCAIGSRDRSLSIWLTSLKRPLVVTHDLFDSSIMDLSWSRCGYRLLACSLDGTVAYLDFSLAEIGKSMTDQEKLAYHKQTYGTSIVSSRSNFASSIIENPEVLKVHQQQQQKERVRKALLAQQSCLNSPSTPNKSLSNGAQATSKSMDQLSLLTSGSFTNGTSADNESAMVILKKQKETRTKDGKRRITPLMIAPPLDVSDNDPMPFEGELGSASESFTLITNNTENRSPKSPSRMMLKSPPAPTVVQSTSLPPSSVSKKASAKQLSSANQSNVSMASSTTTTTVVSCVPPKRKSDSATPSTPVKRGRKEKEKKDKQNRDDSFMLSKPAEDKPTENAHGVFSIPSNHYYVLQHPKPEKTLSLKVNTDVEEVVYETENNLNAISAAVHTLRCTKKETLKWETFLCSPITALAASRSFVTVSCQNKSIHVFSKQGRRILSGILLHSSIAILQCNNAFIMAITSSGHLYVWNITKQEATIKKESMLELLKGVSITQTFLTEKGAPIISLSDGSAYTFCSSLCSWTHLANVEDVLQSSSSYSGCVPPEKPTGILHSLQNNAVNRISRETAGQLRMNSSKQQICTISHLENQMCCALSVGSSEEYRFWLLTYARYLVQSGEESRLRELCEELLGPCNRRPVSGANSTWHPTTLVFRKKELLQDVLPIIACNLRFQRLYTEFKEQLEYMNKR